MESHIIWNKMSRKLNMSSVAGSYWRVWSCAEGLPEWPELVRRCTAEKLVSALQRYCMHGSASAPLWGRTADLQVLRFTNVIATKHTQQNTECKTTGQVHGELHVLCRRKATQKSHDPQTQHQQRAAFERFCFWLSHDYEYILPFEEGNVQMTRPFHSSPRW